jgi:hypothetical protein
LSGETDVEDIMFNYLDQIDEDINEQNHTSWHDNVLQRRVGSRFRGGMAKEVIKERKLQSQKEWMEEKGRRKELTEWKQCKYVPALNKNGTTRVRNQKSIL